MDGPTAHVWTLDEEGCWDRLGAATVGRLGIVEDGVVEIIPVSYRLAGRRLLLTTAQDSRVHALAREQRRSAFEVDYAGPLFDLAWSVLLQGVLRERAREDAEPGPTVHSWLGQRAGVRLEYLPDRLTGRVLQPR